MTSGLYSDGDQPVHMTGVYCNGQETNLLQCSHSFVPDFNCDGLVDAEVVCQGKVNNTVSHSNYTHTHTHKHTHTLTYMQLLQLPMQTVLTTLLGLQRMMMMMVSWKEEWRYALTVHGELSVITFSVLKMLQLFVINLASLEMVSPTL